MKLKYMKAFDGDMTKLPKREVEGSTQFKEPENINKFALLANLAAFALSALCLVPVVLISGGFAKMFEDFWPAYIQLNVALVLCIIIMPIHECVHASFFRDEVRFYTYIKKGLFFVVGTKDMTKGRFVLMSIMPTVLFGFIPYILFFIFPSQLWLGLTGAFNIGAGSGDFFNIYSALTQMPKGALTYMSGQHSFWYMPDNSGETEK